MGTIAPVDLDLAKMRSVVEREGACIVWGGRVRLAPADDVIIGVEQPLDFDSPAQLVASILSKKSAAGSTHVVIDMPVGPTAKVRSVEAANRLDTLIRGVADRIGMSVRTVRSDGTQPVGRGIGPALEARDVLSVLRRERDAPADLRDRALALAGEVIEIGSGVAGCGIGRATEMLDTGKALQKFEAICSAQGGMREPPVAPLNFVVTATRAGVISSIDNRRLSRLAKLAGAPRAASAGLDLHSRLGARVEAGERLMSIHAEAPGELEYARGYLAANPQIISIDE
jgi:thymidine phosphorylase